MECWSLDSSIRFSTVSHWCLANYQVDRLLVSTRLDQDAPQGGLLAPRVHSSIEQMFVGRIVTTLFATAWPGTELVDHCGLVYVIRFDEDVGMRMAAIEEYISKWTQWHDPPLPEDLCLYRRGDEVPVLVSVTHEGCAWLLTERGMTLEGAERSPLSVAELLIPRGQFFVTPTTTSG